MVFVRFGVVLALQDLKQPVVLVVDGLHGGRIAAAIGMMQLDEAAVFGFQVFQGVTVGEVFHGVHPFFYCLHTFTVCCIYEGQSQALFF